MNPADDNIRDALIARFNLSDLDVKHIEERAQGFGRSFAEAAVDLELVTPEGVKGVLGSMLEAGAEQPEAAGIIETAVRLQVASRSIVVRRGGPVVPGKELILAHSPDHAHSEQIRALRTALLLLNEGRRQTNVLALVSPCAGEGRSLLAAELAIAFAQLGRETLLVDADLRRPRQQQLFNAQNFMGLTQALTMRQTPQLLSVEGSPNLTLLTAGTVAMNPLELLSDGQFERLLVGWRSKYEFIVIDTPPVTQFSDGLAIATMAGRILICSRSGETSQSAMKEMLRRLVSTQARILGAVLNTF